MLAESASVSFQCDISPSHCLYRPFHSIELFLSVFYFSPTFIRPTLHTLFAFQRLMLQNNPIFLPLPPPKPVPTFSLTINATAPPPPASIIIFPQNCHENLKQSWGPAGDQCKKGQLTAVFWRQRQRSCRNFGIHKPVCTESQSTRPWHRYWRISKSYKNSKFAHGGTQYTCMDKKEHLYKQGLLSWKQCIGYFANCWQPGGWYTHRQV